MVTSSSSRVFLCSVGVVLLILIVGCRAQRNEGDSCQATPTEKGTCRLIDDCKEEAKEKIRRGERPIVCGFKGNKPIVCCTEKGPITAPNAGEKAKKFCNTIQNRCSNLSTRWRRQLRGNQGTLVAGGIPALSNEFPHMAAIGYTEDEGVVWGCGGALISEDYVLTAAHCLYDSKRGPATLVRLGAEIIEDTLRGTSVSSTKKGQTHRVLERIRHPEYKRPEKYNDVALLKIEMKPMETDKITSDNFRPTMSNSVSPACLHYEGDFKLVDGKAIATGWGRLGFGEAVTPELQKVSLTVLDNAVCNNTFDVEIRTTSTLPRGIDSSCLCAGELEGGKDTCVGDSGGPLQLMYLDGTCATQLIGVTSFGKFCGFENSPAVYMRVKHFVPWIESVVWP